MKILYISAYASIKHLSKLHPPKKKRKEKMSWLHGVVYTIARERNCQLTVLKIHLRLCSIIRYLFLYKAYSYYGLSFHVKSVQDTYKYDICVLSFNISYTGIIPNVKKKSYCLFNDRWSEEELHMLKDGNGSMQTFTSSRTVLVQTFLHPTPYQK